MFLNCAIDSEDPPSLCGRDDWKEPFVPVCFSLSYILEMSDYIERPEIFSQKR